MNEKKIYKGEMLNEDIKKEGEMARKKSSIKPIVDGWGLIITIVGLALLILGSNNKSSFNVGLIILIIGFIRMLYVLVKHGR